MVRLEPGRPRRQIAWQLCWTLFWAALTVAGIFLYPDARGHGTHQQLGLAPCPSELFLHRPCPGCGMTTSWTALLHGKIGSAFSAHWLGPPLYLLFSATAIFTGWAFVKKIGINTDTRAFNYTFIGVFLVFLTYGILRFARLLPS